MTASDVLQLDGNTAATDDANALSPQVDELLRRTFGMQLSVIDGETGQLIRQSDDQPTRDWSMRSEISREVARRGQPEFIDDESPFLALAIPVEDADGSSKVAVGTFVTRRVAADEDLSSQAEALGMDATQITSWAGRQPIWSAEALESVSGLLLEKINSQREIEDLKQEAEDLSVNLSSTYEEISLLYRITQNLRLSETDEGLGQIALEWLGEVVPAEGLALQLTPVAEHDAMVGSQARTESTLLTYGDCPIDSETFRQLIEYTGAANLQKPLVLNRVVTDEPDWPFPDVHQVIAVSLTEGENLFGWLAVFNHTEDEEFGTVEASLMSSVAAILGIHSGNIELYRQQSETMSGIVRALTAAIDAKDQYTCGHSDRVARVAVRLATEMGCDADMVSSIYLSGLLHDIGKIGISDSVLRKPGRLSDDEYEHIKQHVSIGHKILHDLGKLDEVLPVILYHHESWDGRGYPEKLGEKKIPLSARIVAVADAFDAMGSDRPYRKRMPDEKIDAILRKGSGQQWDPEVVDAFFRARDDIRQIADTQYGDPEPVKVELA